MSPHDFNCLTSFEITSYNFDTVHTVCRSPHWWGKVSFPTNFVKSSSYFSITYLSVKILTNCHNLPRNPFQWPICVFRKCIPHRVKVWRDCIQFSLRISQGKNSRLCEHFGLSVYSTGHLRFQITHFMSSSMKPRPSKDPSWNRQIVYPPLPLYKTSSDILNKFSTKVFYCMNPKFPNGVGGVYYSGENER